MMLHASLAHKAALMTGGCVGIVIAVDGGAVPATIAQRRSSYSLRTEPLP